MRSRKTLPDVNKTSGRREKAALAMFLALLVAGGLILVGYFSTGRSWSVAATMLDDSYGHLDDYSVVVFGGVAEPKKSGMEGSDADSETLASSNAMMQLDRSHTMQDAYLPSSEKVPVRDVSEVIMSMYQWLDKKKEVKDDQVYVSDVRDLYALKGASAITLNLSDPSYYREPVLLRAGNKLFGVFSAPTYTSRVRLEKIVSELKGKGANAIICIAPRSAMVATYEGIDVLILTDGEDALEDVGHTDKGVHSALIVPSPEVGDAGVVLFSSNNVPAFKLIEEI